MAFTTLKSIVGYLKTLVGKYTFINVGKNRLSAIYNYQQYSEYLSTSGQPTEGQLALIQQSGVKTVINLAPHNAENSLPDEAGTVAELGMDYIHLPIHFIKPTEQDFQQFADYMGECEGKKIWVHCAANMRVSAFLYRYRRDILQLPEAEARQFMDSIWQPFGVWKKFVEKQSFNYER